MTTRRRKPATVTSSILVAPTSLSTMNKKTHPISEGWLHAKLTLNNKEPLGDKGIAGIKALLTCKDPDAYEFAQFEQHGPTVKAIYRKKAHPAA